MYPSLLFLIFFLSSLLSTNVFSNVSDAVINISKSEVKIYVEIYIYGDGATKILAEKMQEGITKEWGKDQKNDFWKVDSTLVINEIFMRRFYVVKFDVKVNLYGDEENANPLIIPDSWNFKSRKNYIKISKDKIRSKVFREDEGVWELSDDMKIYAHEFGHLLGLSDQYQNAMLSETEYMTVPNPGWEANIMGARQGIVEQKNIDTIMKFIMTKNNETYSTTVEINGPIED